MKQDIKIPPKMLDEYSMSGKVKIEYSYRDDSSIEIQNEINENYTERVFLDSCERINRRECNYYGSTDLFLYNALSDFSICNKDVCVIGSTHPWYETMCLNYGAKFVTVIEYSKRKSFNDRIIYTQPDIEFNKKFDICLSISSFEHDGLGRYGDPLNPNGDIEAMQKMKSILKPGGLMFLAVPIGIDTLWFNVHRIYGANRFYHLINGWNILKDYGFKENSFNLTINNGESTNYQPVTVLSNA